MNANTNTVPIKHAGIIGFITFFQMRKVPDQQGDGADFTYRTADESQEHFHIGRKFSGSFF